MFVMNNKSKSVEILNKYFQKIKISELPYYLNIHNISSLNQSVPKFIESNVYEPDDLDELISLVVEHLGYVIKKIFNHKNPLNSIDKPIGLSFVSGSIYWYEVFSIENTIFITYSYLIRKFNDLESNSYKSVEQVVIEKDNDGNNLIYDAELLKKLSDSIYNVLQYYNKDLWIEFVKKENNCVFVDKNLIEFNSDYKILIEPNTYFIQDLIPIYPIKYDKYICPINSIQSNVSFTPYWNTIYILLEYVDGKYIETNYLNNHHFNELYEPNPFDYITKLITQAIIDS